MNAEQLKNLPSLDYPEPTVPEELNVEVTPSKPKRKRGPVKKWDPKLTFTSFAFATWKPWNLTHYWKYKESTTGDYYSSMAKPWFNETPLIGKILFYVFAFFPIGLVQAFTFVLTSLFCPKRFIPKKVQKDRDLENKHYFTAISM